MPQVRFVTATLNDYDALHNLAQFYQYDFTEFLPGEVNERGEFPYMDVRRYLTNRDHSAYLARVGGRLGGFALVSHRPPQRQRSGRYVAEFFVMRPYRRQGVGRAMAFHAFDAYRGYWEIAEVGPNTPGQFFWRKVIGEYTQGRYEEFTTYDDEEGISVVWQAFDSGAW